MNPVTRKRMATSVIVSELLAKPINVQNYGRLENAENRRQNIYGSKA